MPYRKTGGMRKSDRIRQRERRRKRLARRIVCVILLAAAVLCIKNVIGGVGGKLETAGFGADSETAAGQAGGRETGGEASGGGTEATQQEKVSKILENKEKYPKELVEIAEKNAETADFVLDYPKKKGNTPAEDIGDIKKGTIPLLLQWDERWGYAPYGDNMIAVSGCGPTCVAMVAAGLTGDNTLTPYKIARYAQEQGYYTGEAGTSWELMSVGAQHFGIFGQEISLSESRIFSELESGHPVICSMRPGDFTTTGHFIVLTGVKDGKIVVNDPNSRIRSEKLWDYETLERQINNLWAFTVI